ncbi:MAG: hypothetical protein IH576_02565 [Deltaproteobacteria bacterium]|nr:hypothetical protein [Deltaproteobacteria bacterium]
MLKLIKGRVDPALDASLQESWNFVVSFGHVSSIPEMLSKLATPVVPGTTIQSASFCGPHVGQLPDGLLLHLGGTFAMVAETALQAFLFTFSESLAAGPVWVERYQDHSARIAQRLAEGSAKEQGAMSRDESRRPRSG